MRKKISVLDHALSVKIVKISVLGQALSVKIVKISVLDYAKKNSRNPRLYGGVGDHSTLDLGLSGPSYFI